MGLFAHDGWSLNIWTPLGEVGISTAGPLIFVTASLIFILALSGISFTFWSSIGCLRLITECLGWYPGRRPGVHSLCLSDIAVIVPAHNEEVVIERTLRNLSEHIPLSQIHVASDYSTDRTVAIARSVGCNVADINPNRGKAGALAYTMEHFKLFERYKAIMVLDADSQLGPNFFRYALPYFDDPNVVAFGGYAIAKWIPHVVPRWSHFFSAYRTRLYTLIQAIYRYGQTWRFTNLTPILPGFCAIWRSAVIRQIDITAPGLVIEDFNMTFDLQKKRLGRIGYDRRARAYSQDPHRLGDYWKQVQRWSLGLWQTVRRHGVWPSFFWLSLGIYLLEGLFAAVLTASLPIILFVFALNGFRSFSIALPFVHIVIVLRFADVVLGLFVSDYVATAAVAFFTRKPLLLFYGLGFFFLRFLDSIASLKMIPRSIYAYSQGTWKSPTRR